MKNSARIMSRKALRREQRRRARLLSSTALKRSRKLSLVAFYLRAHDRLENLSRINQRRSSERNPPPS